MPRPPRILPLLAALLGAAALVAVTAHGQAAERMETAALVPTPSDVALADGGALLVADTAGGRVVRVQAGGELATLAAGLAAPRGVAPLPGGGFLVADTDNDRVVRISAAGAATVVAGSGAALSRPGGVAALPDGGFLVADTGNHRVVRVTASGAVATVAGLGRPGFSGDGGPATRALLNAPARVAPLAGGGFLVADTGNNRVRRVAADGTILTVAGSSATPGFGGDGGPAAAALLSAPEGVAVRSDGTLAIADTGNSRVRVVGADGTIRTLAGGATAGLAGDGGPPGGALLSAPRAVAAGPGGTGAGAGGRLWIADTGNGRVRQVLPVAPQQPEPAPPDAAEPPAVLPPAEPPPGVSPPVIGRRAVATAVAGKVRVRLRGTRRFVALDAAASVPLGSEIDARRGSVAVFFVTDRSGTPALAAAAAGRFVLRQPAARPRGAGRPGVLVLSGPLRGCRRIPRRARARAAAGATAARARRAAGRRLKVRAKGRIKTRGRYASAVVRGTAWNTVDRCVGRRAGTLVAVRDGAVAVRDRVRRATVRVPAGRRYLARAPRR